MAAHIQRHNLILALCVAAVAVFLFLWGCPYLALYGHQKLCIALYILLLLIYLGGRARGVRPPRGAPKRGV